MARFKRARKEEPDTKAEAPEKVNLDTEFAKTPSVSGGTPTQQMVRELIKNATK